VGQRYKQGHKDNHDGAERWQNMAQSPLHFTG
jgi:hypothetical protein